MRPTLRAEYESRYEAQFGLRIADVPVELLTWSVSVTTQPEKIKAKRPAPDCRAPAPRLKRDVFDPVAGRPETVPAYRREELGPGMRLKGPALVIEPQTTTLVPHGWHAAVTAAGHLLLERQA